MNPLDSTRPAALRRIPAIHPVETAMPASWHSSTVDRQIGIWWPTGQVRGVRAGLRPEAGPRPHVRRQLALGHRAAARALLGLRHVLGDLRRRRRLDVRDLVTALRRHRHPRQARPAPAARRWRAEDPAHPGHRPATSSSPDRLAACPAAASRAPAATGPCPSYTGCPTTAAGTTWTNPGAPDAQGLPPGRRRSFCAARSSARAASCPTRAVSSPITRYASASRAASSPAGRADSSSTEGTPGAPDTTGNHHHPSPPVNHPPRRFAASQPELRNEQGSARKLVLQAGRDRPYVRSVIRAREDGIWSGPHVSEEAWKWRSGWRSTSGT